MGIKLVVLDPTPACPASSVANQTVGSFRNADEIRPVLPPVQQPVRLSATTSHGLLWRLCSHVMEHSKTSGDIQTADKEGDGAVPVDERVSRQR